MKKIQAASFSFNSVVFRLIVIATVLFTSAEVAVATDWWDRLPRLVCTSDVPTAISYYANLAMCGAGTDPGWGPWFTWDNSSNMSWCISQRKAFDAAGIRDISYTEGFGSTQSDIVSVGSGTPAPITCSNWDWQSYNGKDAIKWSGVWTWFDDPNASFARPYTRTGSSCPGSPMTYANGTVATGFNGSSSDPRNSKVYDAGCAGDVLGSIEYGYSYQTGSIHTGCLSVNGGWASEVSFSKDLGCPCWANYEQASTYFATSQIGGEGTWCDNWSSWDSFCSGPTHYGFGKWSVAGFPTYLQNNFTVAQLISMGVLSSGQTYANLPSFDIRTYMRSKASSTYGWNGSNINSSAWSNSGWINDPVWTAYKIYRRQSGTTALSNYYNAVKAGATSGGQSDYLIQGNDISPCMLGYNRGSLDQASTELSLDWNLSFGSSGVGLPPFGCVAPFYKAAREMAQSRFVNVWLYNDGYVAQMSLTPVVNVLYYEMLATDTTQKLEPTNTEMAGNPAADQACFQFIATQMDPLVGGRTAIEDVGIYCSTSSINWQWTPGGVLNFDSQAHLFAVWGWATALDELHYEYRIIPEWKLTSAVLNTLKVLIIPNAECFNASDVATLTTWVNAGGILIVTGDSGSHQGESGTFAGNSALALSSLTGVSNWNTAPATNTQAIGSGRVRFIQSNYGLTFWSDSTVSARANFLPTIASEMSTQLASAGKSVAIPSTNAPSTEGLTLYQDTSANKLFLDTNNMNLTVASDGSSASVTPTPVINVTIAKPSWWNATGKIGATAYAISPDGPVTLQQPLFDNNNIYLSVPSFNYYNCVVMQPAAASIVSIGGAKTTPDGGTILTNSEVVSAVYSDCFYIQEGSGIKGMRVDWTGTPVNVGDQVVVLGTMSTTADGERTINATQIETSGPGTVTPVTMTNQNLGGTDLVSGGAVAQKGVDQGQGPNNVGLLVNVAGTMSGDGTDFFCLQDGTLTTDGASGLPGVRVLSQGLNEPGPGTFAVVTGISTLKTINGVTYRCVWPRTQQDIQILTWPSLIGDWDFEGSDPLDNKAPGITWDPMIITDGSVTDGKLLLQRYYSGEWLQGRATAMLKTDLGSAGYFKEMTQVAWLYWPDFSPPTTAG